MADEKASAFTVATNFTDVTDDTLPFIQDSTGTPANRQISIANFYKSIDALTAKATPVPASDELVIYSAADSAARKITLSQITGNGLSLAGENYTIIPGNDPDPTVNAQAVRDAYTAAAASTPFGNALSANNRFVLLLMPGFYDFEATPLVMSNAFVDLSGMTAPTSESVKGSTAKLADNLTVLTADSTVISKTVDGPKLKNLALDSTAPTTGNPVISIGSLVGTTADVWQNLYFFTDNPHQPTGITFAGLYINVVSEEGNLFDTDEDCSGQFYHCGGGEGCFAETGNCSGIFVDCWADGNSFAGAGGNASGLFHRCFRIETNTTAGMFGDGGTASGDFFYCSLENGASGFASEGGTFSGEAYHCTAGAGSFGGTRSITSGGVSGMTFSGVAVHCSAGTTSFGGGNLTRSGNFTGLAILCYAGAQSFGHGGAAVTLTGSCQLCRCDSDGFGSNITGQTNAMICVGCTGGSDSFGTGGTVSGTFINCVGGTNSFGSFGVASGQFFLCRGANGSFGGSGGTASGVFYSCTAVNGAFGGHNAGTGGTASGFFWNCTGRADCFGGGSSGRGTMSGQMKNCTIHNRLNATVSGEIYGSLIRGTLGTNQNAIEGIATGAHIHHCTLVGKGSGVAIANPASTQNVLIHHCSLNTALGANISNGVTTPFNVVDSNIV